MANFVLLYNGGKMPEGTDAFSATNFCQASFRRAVG